MTPNKPELDDFNILHFEARHFDKDLPTVLDFEEIMEEMKELTGPTLLLCINGKISGALAMKVLMESNKMFTKELAVA